MKNTNNVFSILLILCMLPALSLSQADRRAKVMLVNTGSIHVAANPAGGSQTTLYLAGSLAATDSSKILQNGITEITGDLLHGADTHIFTTDANGNGLSTGTVIFSGFTSGSTRYITSLGDIASFDRANKYIAFPRIQISTNDEILVGSRMGVDATGISRNGSYKGKLVLKSETILKGDSRRVYDASLRIVGSGNSAALATAGAVSVERDATAYIDSIGLGANTPIFGFATPFKDTQIAGYFASNWLRYTTAGTNEHVAATLGENQFVNNPSIVLIPGNGYFVRLRDKTGNYNSLLSSGIVPSVDGQDLNSTKSKYVFNGKVYDFSSVSEQLFSEWNISRSIAASSASASNWVIGNSYTAPISIAKLGSALSASSPVRFDGNIYLLPYGSTTYQPYNYVTGAGDPSNPSVTEIPGTSVFLLKTAPNSPAGTFNVSKDLLTHDAAAYNTANRSVSLISSGQAGTFYDYASFTVRLATNENIYDRTAIAVYDLSSVNEDIYDAQKIAPDVFGIYTLSADNVALATNKIPTESYPVKMAFVVNTVKTDFNLEVSTSGIVKGQGLWLEDKHMDLITQMVQGDIYPFTASPGDDPNRFVVYFVDPQATSKAGNETLAPIMSVCRDNVLFISNLKEMDRYSEILIMDLQGRHLIEDGVREYPSQRLDVRPLATGTYVLKITGKRNYTVKFIKK